jgi:hypothetical protein
MQSKSNSVACDVVVSPHLLMADGRDPKYRLRAAFFATSASMTHIFVNLLISIASTRQGNARALGPSGSYVCPMAIGLVRGLGLWGQKIIGPALGLGLSGPNPIGLALGWTRAPGSKANRTRPWTRALGPAPDRALVWTRAPGLVGLGVGRAGFATSQPALGL